MSHYSVVGTGLGSDLVKRCGDRVIGAYALILHGEIFLSEIEIFKDELHTVVKRCARHIEIIVHCKIMVKDGDTGELTVSCYA